ncbi:aldehyde dehydrogenase family protein [Sphaerisporangium corydalis]|uniref:Aldehyde dehydrogenase family protein n=1 Tax=Sphaerisporangium corydalis TaxID=1441875 RepID=A0ABV9E863_9ACTN|nr:aldehyde dehydrogenase family protein [Sphaerisporangium corydalis]
MRRAPLTTDPPGTASAILYDPRTGRARASARPGDAGDVARAVADARRAQPGWAAHTTRDRSLLLLRLAGLIEDNAGEYAAAERAGTGKPPADALAEVAQSVDVLRFYAGAARADLAPAAGRRLPGRESWVRWEPFGVVAAVVPWNYPLLMAMWRLAPALAAGNAVVLKPAETTPDSGRLLARHAAQVLGPGVLTTVAGDRDTGRLLVEAEVDVVAFTGSVAGGLDVVSRAGLRKVSLELGGNCPAIVLPDAPGHTYADLARASTYNAGQSCAAPARVITLRENHAETVERLAEAMSALRAGIDFGPLNNAAQAARFDRIMEASGASVRHIGEVAAGEDESGGYWRPATVLAGLQPGDPAVEREVFGPVLTVQAAGDPDEAVRMANGVPQALAASVWSTGLGAALDIAAAVNGGEVWLNCHLEQTAELPHGGRGHSGHGTDLSVLALTEYQRPKTITARLT